MSDDRRIDEPIDADDLRLVEALYGEGPADDVDGDLLSSLRDVRSMFSELPAEDPPAAITARLMSAAAESVAASAPETPSLWARLLRFFEPIGAHPALAAAASLVLVVTIGGVLVLSGRSDVAEPEIAPARAPAATAAEPSPVPKAPAPESPMRQEEAAAPELDRAPAKDSPAPRSGPARDGRERYERPKPGRTETRNRAGANLETERGSGKTGLNFSGGALGADSDDAGDLEGGDAPPQTTSTDLPAMQSQKPKSRKTDAALERLTSKGRKAAARGDCAEVRAVGERVRKLAAAHFRDVYRRDARIDACYRARQKKSAPASAE